MYRSILEWINCKIHLSIRAILVLAIYLALPSVSNACNLGSVTVTTAVDNGDGTYTYTVEICLGVDVNWGAVTSFTLDVGGANIISSSGTWTSTYQYCDGGCDDFMTCSSSVLTGGGSATGNVMGGSVTFSGGGGTGNWLSPDDNDATCISQPNTVCDIITITTDAPGTDLTGTWNEDTETCTHTTTLPAFCTPPTPGFTEDGPHCEGVAFNFTNTGDPAGGMGQPTINWDFGDGNTSTAENPSNIYTTAGTYTVTQTLCANGDPSCCATVTADVTVTAPPTVTLSGIDETCVGACDGSATSSVTGGTSPFTYSWSPSGGTGADASGLCADTYTLTVTDAMGCVVTATVTIASGTGPTAGFTFTGSACLSTNSFDFTNTGDAPGACGMNCPTFSWDFDGDGVIDQSGTNSGAANPTGITYSACGSYTVTQTVDDGSCIATATQTVTVFCEPTASIVGVDESCLGACDGTADLTPSGGTSPYTYAWSNGPTTEDLTSLCSGTYTVTVTDANGCVTTASVTISAGGGPVAGFTYNGNQCLTGNSYTFTNTGTTTAGGATFDWDFGDGGTSTAEDPSYTYSTAGSYTVTQNVILSGCTATATVTIVVYAEPTATVTGVDESCPGACDGSADLTVVLGDAAVSSYSWDNGATTEDLSGICAGTYNVTVTDLNGCTAIASVTIGSGTGVTAGFTVSPASACLTGNSFDFTNTGTPVSDCGMGCPTFTYDFGDGNTSTGTNSGAANPSHTYATAGTFTITQTVDDGSCTATATQTVTVFPEPTASIVGTDLLCNGVCTGAADLTVSGGTTPYTYSWSNSATTEDLSSLCAGTYSVTVTDANGCTAPVASVVIAEPPLLTVTVTGTDVTCNGACDDVMVPRVHQLQAVQVPIPIHGRPAAAPAPMHRVFVPIPIPLRSPMPTVARQLAVIPLQNLYC